jgi:CHAT domain-containing protein
MAALHDGDQYLVARYRNTAYNSMARPGSRTSGAEKSILAVGVSGGYQTLRPLPYVEDELRAIVKTKDSPSGVLPGEKRLNADFTWGDLQSRVRDHYALVHIATHFRFRPENPRGSELLFGDGPVHLDRIKAAEGLFKGVELVVLSGCETGSPGGGDSAEVDALSGAVLTLGAQRVVASLWQVADRSTSQLMANFYRAYRERGDAAEALQTAQTAMLRGGAAASHPYYWAPFFLTAAD